MLIQWADEASAKQAEAEFIINVNIVLKNSKNMSKEQVESLMEHQLVRVVVTAEDDQHQVVVPEGLQVLVNQTAPAIQFKTKSVGYSVQGRGTFKPA